MEDLIARAERVARAAHEGQTDKAGAPYISHPERVARTAAETAPGHLREEAGAVAWLHDAVEDTGTTLETLRAQGFPETVIEGVDAMTKRTGEAPERYFERVRANDIARIVKAADLDDNTSPERVGKLDEETRTRLAAKYRHSRELLAQAPSTSRATSRETNAGSGG
ncbi:HD domain-containing protein [Arthrobacter sp. Z1-15]